MEKMMNTKTEGNTFTKKIGQTVYVCLLYTSEQYFIARTNQFAENLVPIIRIPVHERYHFSKKNPTSDLFWRTDVYKRQTASRITDITKLRWSDAAWMEARKQRDNDSLPVSIYEVHPGSWKKHGTSVL